MDNTGRTGRLVTHDRNSDDKVTIAPFFRLTVDINFENYHFRHHIRH